MIRGNAPSQSEIRDYLDRNRKKGSQTLSLLGRDIAFIQAIQSPIGHELLKDLVSRHETLLEKVGNISATDEEKLEFKVVKRLIQEWTERITRYEKNLDEVVKGAGAGR